MADSLHVKHLLARVLILGLNPLHRKYHLGRSRVVPRIDKQTRNMRRGPIYRRKCPCLSQISVRKLSQACTHIFVTTLSTFESPSGWTRICPVNEWCRILKPTFADSKSDVYRISHENVWSLAARGKFCTFSDLTLTPVDLLNSKEVVRHKCASDSYLFVQTS